MQPPVNRSSEASRRIRLVERSVTRLNSDEFEELHRQPTFLKLLRAKILSIRIDGDRGFSLIASHYLGMAKLENSWILEVTEKSQGAMHGLFSELSNARYKLSDATSDAHIDGFMFAHIASVFLTAVEAYVAFGRQQSYQQEMFSTKRPRGRLDISGTLRYIAQGNFSTASVKAFKLTPNIFPNQVLAHCLMEIEILALSDAAMRSLLPRARALYLVFGDASCHHFRRIPSKMKAELLSEYLKKASVGPVLENALQLALPLFLGGGLHGKNVEDFELLSLFVDMEFLFEHSVFQALKAVPNILVEQGKELSVKIFSEGSARYKCEPDLVVSQSRVGSVAVGDVKYKTLSPSGPSNEDIYQLLAHANAFRAECAFLIYPGDAFQMYPLGLARSDIAVTVFSVSAAQLRLGVNSIISSLFPRLRF